MSDGANTNRRTLPNLARAGVMLNRSRTSEVTFEIHHLDDGTGYLFALHHSLAPNQPPETAKDGVPPEDIHTHGSNDRKDHSASLGTQADRRQANDELSETAPQGEALPDDIPQGDTEDALSPDVPSPTSSHTSGKSHNTEHTIRDAGTDSQTAFHRPESPDLRSPPFLETLSSTAHGVGLVIRTSVRPLHQSTRRTDPGKRQQTQGHPLTTSMLSSVFHGTAQPNPSFIYESVHALEGVVIIDVEPKRLLVAHGEVIREIVTKVATIAGQSNAPLLAINSPVQLPTPGYQLDDLDKRREDWPRACSLAVRFSIAIGPRSSRERVGIATKLAEYSAEHGWGLELRDTRPGRRTGNWFTVVNHDAEKARKRIGTPGRQNRNAVNWCCPITFVGPARVGSTKTIMRFLGAHNPAATCGVSIASLDDLAFIHAVLALPDGTRKTQRAATAGLAAWSTSPRSNVLTNDLSNLLQALQIDPPNTEQLTKRTTQLLERASDYQLFAGPLIPTEPMDPPTRPLWIAWDVERTPDGLSTPLFALEEATKSLAAGPPTHSEGLEQLPAPFNIEYLACRDVGDATLRARGKLSVPDTLWHNLYPEHRHHRAAAAKALASNLEERWRQRLRTFGDGIRGDVTVAWQESWLNRDHDDADIAMDTY